MNLDNPKRLLHGKTRNHKFIYKIGTLLKPKNSPSFEQKRFCVVIGFIKNDVLPEENKYILYSQEKMDNFDILCWVVDLFFQEA